MSKQDKKRLKLQERIKQNLTKRIAILTEIATQLNNEITSVVLINEEIKRLENTKIDTSLLENLTKQIPIKETQCKALDQKIDTLASYVEPALIKKMSGREVIKEKLSNLENILGLSQLSTMRLNNLYELHFKTFFRRI